MAAQTKNQTYYLQKKVERIFQLEKESAQQKLNLEVVEHQKMQLMDKINKVEAESANKISKLTNENNKLNARLRQLQKVARRFEITQTTIGDDKNMIDENIWEVKNILAHRSERNKTYFLIRWKNFDRSYDSWVEKKNLSCPKVLKKYLRSCNNISKRAKANN